MTAGSGMRMIQLGGGFKTSIMILFPLYERKIEMIVAFTAGAMEHPL